LRGVPLALSEEVRGSRRVTVCSSEARGRGLYPGMPLAEAEALTSPRDPQPIHFRVVEPQDDRRLLERLALACQSRFSPLVSLEDVERPECLFLDVQGCGHLFGGEEGLVASIERFLARNRFWARLAMAESAGAAWGLAHFEPHARKRIVAVGALATAIEKLPPAALRLPEPVLQLLEELDLRTIGQLRNMPPVALGERFGPLIIRRLHQALGIIDEVLVPYREEPLPSATWSDEFPVTQRDALTLIVSRLLNQILALCQKRMLGAVSLKCVLTRPCGSACAYVVEVVRPTCDATKLLSLLELQWERQPLPASASAVELTVLRAGRIKTVATNLFGHPDEVNVATEVQSLIERLTSRLGPEAVVQPLLTDNPLPECSVTTVPAIEVMSQRRKLPPPEVARHRLWRPTRLLDPAIPTPVLSIAPDGPPRQLTWENRAMRIVHAWGPERIESGWWKTSHIKREYYVCETDSGLWLWVYRERPSGAWFVHGLFD